MIIQSIALLDQMDKDINTFAMRVREWYSWHFPELKDLVKDNFLFAQCAAFIKVKTDTSNSGTSVVRMCWDATDSPRCQFIANRINPHYRKKVLKVWWRFWAMRRWRGLY